MKKILFPFVFLMSLGAFAQTGVIKGIILDKQSESPLEGATVELFFDVVGYVGFFDFDGGGLVVDGLRLFGSSNLLILIWYIL